jgi:hypothetical protein
MYSRFVSTWREPILLLHGFFFFFCRRRRAFRAFSPSSYAVMTNTEPGVGSGRRRPQIPTCLGLAECDP